MGGKRVSSIPVHFNAGFNAPFNSIELLSLPRPPHTGLVVVTNS